MLSRSDNGDDRTALVLQLKWMSAYVECLLCRCGDALAEMLESGQTDNVIQLLLEWLHHAHIYLSADEALLGNVDTVSRLITEHQVLSASLCLSVCGLLVLP